jgi:hypothetical protein
MKPAPASPGGGRPDYRHVIPLFLLLGGGLLAGFGIQRLALPATFGAFGPYRGTAVHEARDARPIGHVGESRCAECHDDKAKLHDKDVHSRVPCETCHGPGGAHVAAEGDGPIRVPKGKDACLVCHRRLDGRPGDFPQIRWQEHYRAAGVTDESIACTACHDPHEPLFMDRDVRAAR